MELKLNFHSICEVNTECKMLLSRVGFGVFVGFFCFFYMFQQLMNPFRLSSLLCNLAGCMNAMVWTSPEAHYFLICAIRSDL